MAFNLERASRIRGKSMERHRFVYLTGLLPVLVSSVLLFLWMLLAAPLLSLLGVILTLVSLVVALLGCYLAYKYYSDSTSPATEQKSRRKHFLGHCVALSLGLAFSFQTFQFFRQNLAVPNSSQGLVITIKNTSLQPAKNFHVQVGLLNETIKEIPAQGKQVLTTHLAAETTLTAQLGNGENAQQAKVLVGPQDHNVLLRLDPLQNILPDVN